MGEPVIQHEPADLWCSNPPTGPGVRKRVDKCFQIKSAYLLATLQLWSPWRQRTKPELWTHWFLFSFHMKYLKHFLLPENIRWGICDHTWWAMVCQQDHEPIVCSVSILSTKPLFRPCSRWQFNLSMTGGRSGPEIAAFWDHCFQQEEWRNHPARFLPYVKRDRSLFAINNDENHCISLGYCLSFLYSVSFQRIDSHRIPHWWSRILFQFGVLCVEHWQHLSNWRCFSKSSTVLDFDHKMYQFKTKGKQF